MPVHERQKGWAHLDTNNPDYGLSLANKDVDIDGNSETNYENSGQKTQAEAEKSQEIAIEKYNACSKVMSYGKHDRSFDKLSLGSGLEKCI